MTYVRDKHNDVTDLCVFHIPGIVNNVLRCVSCHHMCHGNRAKYHLSKSVIRRKHIAHNPDVNNFQQAGVDGLVGNGGEVGELGCWSRWWC